jgi:hypothetical protein
MRIRELMCLPQVATGVRDKRYIGECISGGYIVISHGK